MQVTVDIDKTQIVRLIDQLAINEKLQLVKQSEKETFKYRLENLRESIPENDLTDEDILAEVMSVRNK